MKHDKGAKAGYLPAVDFTGGAFERDDKAIAAALKSDPFYRLMPMLTVDEQADRQAEEHRPKPTKKPRPAPKDPALDHTDRELVELEALRYWPKGPEPGRSPAHTCPVCGCYKPARWTLCHDCLHEWGGKAEDWPAWVQFAVNDAASLRKRRPTKERNEILLGSYEPHRLATQRERRSKYPPPGDVNSYRGDGFGWLYLPFAPYPDEAKNREYRRANGIRPIRTPRGAQEAAQSPTEPQGRHYDATHPNLPAGWWEAGSWIKHGAASADGRPQLLHFLDGDNAIGLDDRQQLGQIMAEARRAMTAKQYQCIQLAAQGLAQAEIAERMSTSQQTVSRHWIAALEKIERARTNFLH
jgi:DNA-binding CsgD family transcriptional regulator